MKIAHVILTHTDPVHIGRLVRRLAAFSDVFVHVDLNADIDEFKSEAGEISNCFFIGNRRHCSWGGYNAAEAEVELLRAAISHDKYDRITFIQGADYPLKIDEEIVEFYKEHRETQFLRACMCTGSRDPYFYSKCRYYLFYDNRNLIKKAVNRLAWTFHLKVRDGYVRDGHNKYEVYWGCAQWSFTGECAAYVVDYHDKHKEFNRWFRHAFPADELYFATLIMNSPYRESTAYKGPEPATDNPDKLRNLHYFKYIPGKIKILTLQDLPMLETLSELYIRKVNTHESTDLLDALDKINNTKTSHTNVGEKENNESNIKP